MISTLNSIITQNWPVVLVLGVLLVFFMTRRRQGDGHADHNSYRGTPPDATRTANGGESRDDLAERRRHRHHGC